VRSCQPARSSDPDDDYLISLAAAHVAVLVSGDKHLLNLAAAIPVPSPRPFLEPRDAPHHELTRCDTRHNARPG
jgi:predicted nucleic acid-binding protein